MYVIRVILVRSTWFNILSERIDVISLEALEICESRVTAWLPLVNANDSREDTQNTWNTSKTWLQCKTSLAWNTFHTLFMLEILQSWFTCIMHLAYSPFSCDCQDGLTSCDTRIMLDSPEIRGPTWNTWITWNSSHTRNKCFSYLSRETRDWNTWTMSKYLNHMNSPNRR